MRHPVRPDDTRMIALLGSSGALLAESARPRAEFSPPADSGLAAGGAPDQNSIVGSSVGSTRVGVGAAGTGVSVGRLPSGAGGCTVAPLDRNQAAITALTSPDGMRAKYARRRIGPVTRDRGRAGIGVTSDGAWPESPARRLVIDDRRFSNPSCDGSPSQPTRSAVCTWRNTKGTSV